MVHHDIWDYDNATAPKLLTVRHNGKTVDVVAQAGKTGFLYVFNRVTGEPLWPIEERPVPKSDVPGETGLADAAVPDRAAAVRAPDVHREGSQPVHRRSRRERARFLDDIRGARNEGLFTPPGLDATRSRCRATTAASNFGGAAVDPEHGTVFVVSKDLAGAAQAVAPRRRGERRRRSATAAIDTTARSAS